MSDPLLAMCRLGRDADERGNLLLSKMYWDSLRRICLERIGAEVKCIACGRSIKACDCEINWT